MELWTPPLPRCVWLLGTISIRPHAEDIYLPTYISYISLPVVHSTLDEHCDGDKKKLPLSMNQPVLSLTIQASARVLSLKAPCSGISPFPLQRQSYSNCYQSLHLFSIAHQLQRRRLRRRRRRQPSSQVQSRQVSGAQPTAALEATLQRRPKVARQPLEPTRPP